MDVFVVSISNFYSGKNNRLTFKPKTPLQRSLQKIDKLCYVNTVKNDSQRDINVRR